MTELEKKWRYTGLLEGNRGVNAEVLASNLERCDQFLLTKTPLLDARHVDDTLYLLLRDGDSELEYTAGMLLPIITRLHNERNVRAFDIKKLYHQFRSYKKGWKPSCPCCSGMDHEAEMCSDFCKEF